MAYDKNIIGWFTRGGNRIPIRSKFESNTSTSSTSGENITNKYMNDMIRNGANKGNVIKSELEKEIESTETNVEDAGVDDSLANNTIDGKLSPERERIHQEIIKEYFEGKEPVENGEDKYYYMTGGGSGTGKSNFVKNLDNKYFDKDFKYNEKTEQFDGNVIKIDADDLKGRIYARASDGRKFDASYLHEESSALSKRINTIATDMGYNTMLDSTGDGSPKKLLGKINDAKAKGYKVVACYGTCDIQKALENNYDRFYKKLSKNDPTARYVNENDVVDLHRAVTNTLIANAKYFDKVDLYDMNDYNNIRKIASGGNGKELKVAKEYQKLYNEFASKGALTDQEVYKLATDYADELERKGTRPIR